MPRVTSDRLIAETIARQGKYALSAQTTPHFGSNLVSFTVDGAELISWDEKGLLDDGVAAMRGAFNMFPTPCRLAGSSYEFEGKVIQQQKHGQDVSIHGLLRDEAMAYANHGDSMEAWLTITPEHPVHEGFPFNCKFTISHALHDAGLTVGFKLENRDACNIPFGYGIHPFWRIHGERKDVSVRVPCDSILELADLVPTGEHAPVAGTDLDLRTLRNIDGLFIDNAFWKRNPGDTAEVVFDAIGKQLTIEASDNFPHMIVYAPEGQAFVCVENLTTCPNAPNLVSAGKGELANMLVAARGETVEGWINYTISDIADG